MRRHLLATLALVSLPLFVAVVVLWVRSYFVGDGFVWKPTDAPPYYRAYTGRGVVRVGSGRYHFDHPPHFDYHRDPTPTRQTGYHPGTLADRLGFDVHRGSDSHGMPASNAILPLWSVALASAVLPVVWVRRVRRGRVIRRLADAGQCRRCGYDLRATPERCPECGHVGTAAAAPPSSNPSSRSGCSQEEPVQPLGHPVGGHRN